mmetsp:Transcript_128644/g.320843  ORF Transcript_128644/g.320843 Transcript_128644/m.320843 type:complete len:229 (-) Transcript_128644:181-867(-)
MVAHADKTAAVVADLEGLVPQRRAVARGGRRVQAGAVDEVAGLDPGAGLHSVHRVAVEGRLGEQVDEVPCELGALLVKELYLHQLLLLPGGLERQRAVGSARRRLHRGVRLVGDALVEDEPRVVLVLEPLVGPLHEAILVQEEEDCIVCLCEDHRSARLALHEAPAVLADNVPQLLLVLRLEEALDHGIDIWHVARQVLSCHPDLLEGGVPVLAVDVDLVVRRRPCVP